MTILTDKTCSDCGVTKSADNFTATRNQCKPCVVIRTNQWYQGLSAEQRRTYELKKNARRRHRMSLKEYQDFIAPGCEICGSQESLCIDHDHSCCPKGKSCADCRRGVLCSRHNQGEGYFKSVDEITALLAYRMKFEKLLENEGTV